MKKILHVIAQEPGKTGSGVFLKNILCQAHSRGYSQALVAGVPLDAEPGLYGLPEAVVFEPVRFESEELPFSVVGMSDEMPYKSARYGDLTREDLDRWERAFGERLGKVFETFKPDVVMTHHLWLLTALVKETFPEIPVMAFSHGSDLRQMRNNGIHGERVSKACRGLDRVMALNPYQKDAIRETYGISESVIKITGGGYDRDCFHEPETLPEKRKSGQIIYAGKISHAKGFEVLLRAFEKISKLRPGVGLSVAGSGAGPSYEALAERAKAMKGVALLGNLEQKELARLFRKGDVFALPSFYEGLPLVLVEAAACGLKLVASRLGGIEAWLGRDMMESGNAALVALPRMASIDKPFEEDLDDYANRFAEALMAQLDLSPGPAERKIQRDFVRGKSWEAVFDAIEKQMP